MAGNLSREFENDLADYLVGRTPSGHSTLPAATATSKTGVTLYVALFTTTLDELDTTCADGTEVSGGAYARQALPGSEFGTGATGGSVSNDAELAFPEATANWGTVESWAIVEGNTGSTDKILVWCDDPSVAINDGDTAKFNSDQMTITVD